MSDIAALLNQSEEWRELSRKLAERKAPQALLAIIPPLFAEAFRDLYARQLLCLSGTGEDGCGSCRLWVEGGHPDLVVAGTGGKPPGIADCISLHGQLSLHPVAAPCRLAVIPEADGLSLPAANSLLKLAEEPPKSGYLLFVAEKDDIIPTIKSRVWTIRFRLDQGGGTIPLRPPCASPEWAKWFEGSKNKKLDEVLREAEAWVLWHEKEEDWETACLLKNALFLAQKRHLPVSMVQDVLFALLKEGIKSDQIFGDLREA